MTAADWGDWLKPWMDGRCRPCGTCDIGLHDKCAWRPGGAHEGGWNTHIAYLMVGTGPNAHYAGNTSRSWRLYEKAGRKWHCTCDCHRNGYRTPITVPNAEWSLF
ncbi:hypothetical protein [Rhodococcus rhodochrous]|uniref:hypothetical protein n=1 Tax=Rhodococcus rhodochrous TaxID=1829 RepID=UPI001E36D5E7|nr:hypothetical protein [Rhodococcus rhodochrous]MCD2096553.1 hypothetical protein [Rhodococcus rhodochrous]MCD2121229.1 hypothetical protein [Rhodococcus rhodochrous]MCQ4137323.1 hypothetical protein [Rhodococcus rhodochrous]MDJ0021184.1 hypothetical protein [Rhodococcus rhodochrous]